MNQEYILLEKNERNPDTMNTFQNATKEMTVIRWFVMRAYKSEGKAAGSGHTEFRICTCQPNSDHGF